MSCATTYVRDALHARPAAAALRLQTSGKHNVMYPCNSCRCGTILWWCCCRTAHSSGIAHCATRRTSARVVTTERLLRESSACEAGPHALCQVTCLYHHTCERHAYEAQSNTFTVMSSSMASRHHQSRSGAECCATHPPRLRCTAHAALPVHAEPVALRRTSCGAFRSRAKPPPGPAACAGRQDQVRVVSSDAACTPANRRGRAKRSTLPIHHLH